MAHDDFIRRNPDLMRILLQARGMLKVGRRDSRALRASLQKHLGRVAALIEAVRRGPGPAASRTLAMPLFGSVSGGTSVGAAARAQQATRMPPRAFAEMARARLD